MALIGPILDNRTYDQLRDELVGRIRVYAPEWTDHNESDPGIALLELFAFLGETLLFRFNQIPDATKIEFLRLLGVRPRPAQAATALLALTTELPGGVQVLSGAEASAGEVFFQTTDEVYAWPLTAVAAGKIEAPTPATTADQDRRDDVLARLRKDRPTLAAADVRYFETAVVPEDPAAPGAQPLRVTETLDRALWIALLRGDTTDERLLPGRTLFVGVAMEETVDVPGQFDLAKLHDLGAAGRFRSTGLDPDRGAAAPATLWRLWAGTEFVTLPVVGDTSGGLVHSGVVKLALPDRLPVLPATGTGPAGTDEPPPLADEKQAAAVIGWLHVSRPSGEADGIHGVRWVGLNAVEAEQARTAGAELLGAGTGDAAQRLRLINFPVLPRTVRLQVEEPDGWHDWTEVDTFAGTGPDDRHYQVDAAAGEVFFPNRGRVPQIGERVRALGYRYGGGRRGRVGARTITRMPQASGAIVSNPLPATGGADAMSLADALDAIPGEVHRRDRAVVAEDFRELAGNVAGVQRAEVLPLLHPDNPTEPAAGVVTVVVFPDEDLRSPSAPSPDLSLLRRTAAYLDERRLLTTELYVVPPTYHRLAVSVGVRVRPGYQVDAVRRWVELIVRQFLAPVPPYGPDGGGWPLGRTVRRAELEAIAVQVDGVEFLEGLLLRDGGAGADTALIELRPWEVPELVTITVVPGAPLEPGAPYQPAPPDRPVVLAPLPPEVC